MEPDLSGILIISLFGGGITTFIGAIIKFLKCGDILNFYDEKNNNKEKVSKIVGGDIFYTGLCVIFVGIISLFVGEKYYSSMMMAQVIVLIAGLILSFYHLVWTCKN